MDFWGTYTKGSGRWRVFGDVYELVVIPKGEGFVITLSGGVRRLHRKELSAGHDIGSACQVALALAVGWLTEQRHRLDDSLHKCHTALADSSATGEVQS